MLPEAPLLKANRFGNNAELDFGTTLGATERSLFQP